MSLLTASDLAFMQATQQEAMPGTVVIQRYTFTGDGQGGFYEAWHGAGTVIGRVYPMRVQGLESEGGGQLISETRWFATLPNGTEVHPQDRLSYQSRTWEVVRVNNDEMYITALRCEVVAHNEESRV